MLYCKNCGNELEDNDKFCSKCGTPIEVESQERQIKYEGNIHKCPNCGEVLKSFVANCPSCGYELREIKNSISLREFVKKLDEIEKSRPNENKTLLKEVYLKPISIDETTQHKISLIRNFPIPNTKEDLLEFFILASSNINTKMFSDFYGVSKAEEAISEAWKSKYEQAYKKALITFGNTEEFKTIQDIYDKTNEQIKKASNSNKKFWVSIIMASILILIFVWIIVFMTGSLSKTDTNETDMQQVNVGQYYNFNYDIK